MNYNWSRVNCSRLVGINCYQDCINYMQQGFDICIRRNFISLQCTEVKIPGSKLEFVVMQENTQKHVFGQNIWSGVGRKQNSYGHDGIACTLQEQLVRQVKAYWREKWWNIHICQTLIYPQVPSCLSCYSFQSKTNVKMRGLSQTRDATSVNTESLLKFLSQGYLHTIHTIRGLDQLRHYSIVAFINKTITLKLKRKFSSVQFYLESR